MRQPTERHGSCVEPLVRVEDRARRRESSVMTGPVLGLCSFTHDSAAALVVDGELVGLVEEERLSGIKHDKSFPKKGVTWLLSKAGLSPGDVETVALHFQHDLYRKAAPR